MSISGASAAVLDELATAIVRHQAFRTALLQRQDDNSTPVNNLLLPVLVAVAEVSS